VGEAVSSSPRPYLQQSQDLYPSLGGCIGFSSGCGVGLVWAGRQMRHLPRLASNAAKLVDCAAIQHMCKGTTTPCQPPSNILKRPSFLHLPCSQAVQRLNPPNSGPLQTDKKLVNFNLQAVCTQEAIASAPCVKGCNTSCTAGLCGCCAPHKTVAGEEVTPVSSAKQRV
jgi:hypothetical protein